MIRLNPGEVKEILQMLEDGVRLMSKLDKVEKMKMRSKIRRQFNWLSGLSVPTADMIFHKLKEKLSDAFSLYPCGFSDEVKRLLEKKSARFRSM